jgi:hypothetical protein
MGDDKPDPLTDVFKGLSLLLRAARTTVERIPKKGLEDAAVETAREVGRAIENVANVVEREVFGHRPPPEPGPEVEREKQDAQARVETKTKTETKKTNPVAEPKAKDPFDPPPTPPHTD